MASIQVHSLQFSVELQMAGFSIYMENAEVAPKMRATIPGVPHRKLRSLANKVWKNTLEEYGSFKVMYYSSAGRTIEKTIPTFANTILL